MNTKWKPTKNVTRRRSKSKRWMPRELLEAAWENSNTWNNFLRTPTPTLNPRSQQSSDEEIWNPWRKLNKLKSKLCHWVDESTTHAKGSTERHVHFSCKYYLLQSLLFLCNPYLTDYTFKTKKEHKTQCRDDLAVGTIRHRLSIDYDYFNKMIKVISMQEEIGNFTRVFRTNYKCWQFKTRFQRLIPSVVLL